MKFRIEKGMHIIVEGSVSVYTPRGEYQFQTIHIEPYGKGALALAFEQLKEKLKSKGYFDTQRKKPIPKDIKRVALVTAKDSAALHDMLKIIEQRWALVEVTVVDTLVQGKQAGSQIANSLAYADKIGVDVVVVGRGGGSSEDLWAFNEEIVADAIYAMNTPVVSAVGHEVDVVISDFVADLRAPTPSAAIEMILPDSNEVLYMLDEIQDRYKHEIKQKIIQSERSLKHIEEMFKRVSPARILRDIENRFFQYQNEFKRIVNYKLEQFMMQIPEIRRNFKHSITLKLQDKQQHLEILHEKLKIGDPKLQCHKGWAQISYKNRVMSLSEIHIDEKFILEDASVQMKVLCLEKKSKKR
jgi:exodeoxyribonuclease VII large subunit